MSKAKESATVLVTDGRQIYALLHAEDTVLALAAENNPDWEKLSVEYSHGPAYRGVAGVMHFLAHDPRIVVLPIAAAQAGSLGAKVYSLAADPFKFPEAVLISGGGKGYGRWPSSWTRPNLASCEWIIGFSSDCLATSLPRGVIWCSAKRVSCSA